MRSDEVSTGLGWFIWASLAEQVVAWIISRIHYRKSWAFSECSNVLPDCYLSVANKILK